MGLEFKRLALGDICTLKPFFADNLCRICDCTIGGTFMWRDFHQTEFAIEDGVLYIKVASPTPAFAHPRSARSRDFVGDPYRKIIEYCNAAGLTAEICSVSEAVLKDILEQYPQAQARTDRAWSDYLYESSDIVTLAGRKFSGQRNHINRFMKEYPVWTFERISESNIGAVKDFIRKYAQEYSKDYPAYTEGNVKALEVLDNWDAYGQSGGALFAAGEIVGVSIGEAVHDTLYVHVEKASPAHHGSYPMLMNQFARMLVSEQIKYINREEDDGVEGLRASKLSYHPIAILDKYSVSLIERNV